MSMPAPEGAPQPFELYGNDAVTIDSISHLVVTGAGRTFTDNATLNPTSTARAETAFDFYAQNLAENDSSRVVLSGSYPRTEIPRLSPLSPGDTELYPGEDQARLMWDMAYARHITKPDDGIFIEEYDSFDPPTSLLESWLILKDEPEGDIGIVAQRRDLRYLMHIASRLPVLRGNVVGIVASEPEAQRPATDRILDHLISRIVMRGIKPSASFADAYNVIPARSRKYWHSLAPVIKASTRIQDAIAVLRGVRRLDFED